MRKPKPQGKGIVKALHQKGTTGNFAKIAKAKGKGAAIGALQNKLAKIRGQKVPYHKRKEPEAGETKKHEKGESKAFEKKEDRKRKRASVGTPSGGDLRTNVRVGKLKTQDVLVNPTQRLRKAMKRLAKNG